MPRSESTHSVREKINQFCLDQSHHFGLPKPPNPVLLPLGLRGYAADQTANTTARWWWQSYNLGMSGGCFTPTNPECARKKTPQKDWGQQSKRTLRPYLGAHLLDGQDGLVWSFFLPFPALSAVPGFVRPHGEMEQRTDPCLKDTKKISYFSAGSVFQLQLPGSAFTHHHSTEKMKEKQEQGAGPTHLGCFSSSSAGENLQRLSWTRIKWLHECSKLLSLAAASPHPLALRTWVSARLLSQRTQLPG